MGSSGCERSSAWICVFSSAHNTQRLVGRMQVQAHDVPHFFNEQRVLGELARLGPVRLQNKRTPDAAHRALARPGDVLACCLVRSFSNLQAAQETSANAQAPGFPVA